MRLVVVTPHFMPDVAPTGAVVTRIVEELGRRDHRIEVVTALPWYRDHRIEEGFAGRLVRHEDTPWGSIVRVHPFPTVDKQDIFRRGLAFAGFSFLIAALGRRGEPVDGVLALSPPLTLGLSGRSIARARRAPFVFNLQDVYPDVAIELGVLDNKRLIAATRRLERYLYRRADAITVLSDDIKDNVAAKVSDVSKVRVIPNFVDTEAIIPVDRENAYRAEHGLSNKFIVMYAGNVGLSQSFDLILEAAAALAYEDDVVFVINGQGAVRPEVERKAAGMPNVRFVDMQPPERLSEVLAAADVHLVPLRPGLASASVPSKTYSILAAGRPLVASVDAGSEVSRVVERAGAGTSVAPGDAEAFTKAIRALVESPETGLAMGASGRAWIESWASSAAVAQAYEDLFSELAGPPG